MLRQAILIGMSAPKSTERRTLHAEFLTGFADVARRDAKQVDAWHESQDSVQQS